MKSITVWLSRVLYIIAFGIVIYCIWQTFQSLNVKKSKITGYNKEDVLSDKLIVVNVGDMKRKELELFADRMRIDRNSFLLRQEKFEELENKISELETELYFCNRNRQLEKIVGSSD